MKKLFILLSLFISLTAAAADAYSVAGLFPLQGSGRIIYNFNQGWRFHLGDAAGAEATTFDDSKWQVVCAPHSVRLEPSEASGCRNYQGIAWYRKHFTVPADMQGRNVTVYFEAIMGKQDIFVNGKKVESHLGGYLPITVDLTKLGVKAGEECLIAVKADNSDDKTYPPGKKQAALDFCYHGGMYRDVWLIGKSPVAITDANEAGKVAGGGVFLHYDNISEKSADVFVNVEVGNTSASAAQSTVAVVVKDKSGKRIKSITKKVKVGAKSSATAYLAMKLKDPNLWSPESPYLYNVEISVMQNGKTVDGGMVRMGIRKAEFRGKDGFWLNGKPYHQLVGGNRHQDFAYVGNAMPNSQQWRDAKRLRKAGMTIIRCAHYPMDPAFMDACDELGLFVIVPTPGWQYWNKDPRFGELVHENTRQIIRRDRNHCSVLMWEPILNETRYPEDFAINALQITKDEFPYPGRPAAVADVQSAGVRDNYDVVYDWADNIGKGNWPDDKCVFTREFGEMVDDWYAHNNINRAARAWGERPTLRHLRRDVPRPAPVHRRMPVAPVRPPARLSSRPVLRRNIRRIPPEEIRVRDVPLAGPQRRTDGLHCKRDDTVLRQRRYGVLKLRQRTPYGIRGRQGNDPARSTRPGRSTVGTCGVQRLLGLLGSPRIQLQAAQLAACFARCRGHQGRQGGCRAEEDALAPLYQAAPLCRRQRPQADCRRQRLRCSGGRSYRRQRQREAPCI